MLYYQNKSCVKSCQKTLLFKKTLFSPKTYCFPTCALFYPIVLKQKVITGPNTYIMKGVGTEHHSVYNVVGVVCVSDVRSKGVLVVWPSIKHVGVELALTRPDRR